MDESPLERLNIFTGDHLRPLAGITPIHEAPGSLVGPDGMARTLFLTPPCSSGPLVGVLDVAKTPNGAMCSSRT